MCLIWRSAPHVPADFADFVVWVVPAAPLPPRSNRRCCIQTFRSRYQLWEAIKTTHMSAEPQEKSNDVLSGLTVCPTPVNDVTTGLAQTDTDDGEGGKLEEDHLEAPVEKKSDASANSQTEVSVEEDLANDSVVEATNEGGKMEEDTHEAPVEQKSDVNADSLSELAAEEDLADDSVIEEASSPVLCLTSPIAFVAPVRECDACKGKHSKHICGKGNRGPRSPSASNEVVVPCYTVEEFEGWHNFRKSQWRALRVWRKQGKGPKVVPGECAAKRPHNMIGGFACESCGGRFARCFGSYGARDAQGVWTPGSTTDLRSLPESPNGRWCCAPCEAIATAPRSFVPLVKTEAAAAAAAAAPADSSSSSSSTGSSTSVGFVTQLVHPFSPQQPRPFKAALFGGVFPTTTTLPSPNISSSMLYSQQQQQAYTPANKKKDPNAPKQPKSSYLFFAESVRETIKIEHPDADFLDMGRLTGLRWKALSEEEKEPFNAQAGVAKQEYQDAMAAYIPPQNFPNPVVQSGGGGVMVGGRCRACPGCLAPDCGVCRFCEDKVKFGGPGALKHACIDRKCVGTRIPSAPSPSGSQSYSGIPCAACRGQHKRHTCDPAQRIPRTHAAAAYATAAWGGSPPSAAAASQQSSGRKKDPRAPKQAKSSYLFFAESVRETIKVEHPEADFIEMGKLTGLRWKALSEEEKEPFNAQAGVAKEEYQKAMAAYVPPAPPPSKPVFFESENTGAPPPVLSSSSSSQESSSGAFDDDGSGMKRKRASGTLINRLKSVIVEEFKAKYEEEVALAQAQALADHRPSDESQMNDEAAEGEESEGPTVSSSIGSEGGGRMNIVVRHRGMTVGEVLLRPSVQAAIAMAGISKAPVDIARDFLENSMDTRCVRMPSEPPTPSSLQAAAHDAATVAAANAAALAAVAMGGAMDDVVSDDADPNPDAKRAKVDDNAKLEGVAEQAAPTEEKKDDGGDAPVPAPITQDVVMGASSPLLPPATLPPPLPPLPPTFTSHEPRYVYNPNGCDKRPNVSRQSLVRAVHCASGAKVLMRGSHVAYALANAVAAHAYLVQGKKCPQAGSIQSSVHARLRRNAGDRADAYGFEWVAVLPEDEAQEIANNTTSSSRSSSSSAVQGGEGGEGSEAPGLLLSTEAEADAYGRALVAADGGGFSELRTRQPPKVAAPVIVGGEVSTHVGAGGVSSGSPRELVSGAVAGSGSAAGSTMPTSGVLLPSGVSAVAGANGTAPFSFPPPPQISPAVRQAMHTSGKNWKPWKCPEPGCSKAYTLERNCSKHPLTTCVRQTENATAEATPQGFGTNISLHSAAPSQSQGEQLASQQDKPLPSGEVSPAGELASATSALQQAASTALAPQPSAASSNLEQQNQLQASQPYSFVSANRVYVAL